MKQNMGSADRIIRTILSFVIIVLYLTDQITGTAAIVLGVVAVIFLITGSIGFCPAYYPLKISTKKRQN